jgi:glycosyltransferase involved in cell wall biosynthesis
MGFFRNNKVATVAFNLRPRSGPYGGGNQWAAQLSSYLRRCGYRVVYRLDDSVDLVMGTHAGLNGPLEFSYADVLAAKQLNPKLRCIQRINDNDIRKGTGGMDAHLAAANRAADHTIFVSDWLREYHVRNWFEESKPHSVILNGANPEVFHPFGNHVWDGKSPFRLVTHHWSDNPSKGFGVYAQIDDAIAAGFLPGVELRIVGRWPEEINWKTAHTFGPCAGHRLAALLRECHAAVTASRHEPGAMHPVEALQCGLPLLYTADTGGTVELGRIFGVLLGENLVSSVRDLQKRHADLRHRALAEGPGGDVMCAAYRRLIQSVLASHR